MKLKCDKDKCQDLLYISVKDNGKFLKTYYQGY